MPGSKYADMNSARPIMTNSNNISNRKTSSEASLMNRKDDDTISALELVMLDSVLASSSTDSLSGWAGRTDKHAPWKFCIRISPNTAFCLPIHCYFQRRWVFAFSSVCYWEVWGFFFHSFVPLTFFLQAKWRVSLTPSSLSRKRNFSLFIIDLVE